MRLEKVVEKAEDEWNENSIKWLDFKSKEWTRAYIHSNFYGAMIQY